MLTLLDSLCEFSKKQTCTLRWEKLIYYHYAFRRVCDCEYLHEYPAALKGDTTSTEMRQCTELSRLENKLCGNTSGNNGNQLRRTRAQHEFDC